MFEERCHKMVSLHWYIPSVYPQFFPLFLYFASASQGTAIRDRIQESLRGQQGRGLLEFGDESDDDQEYFYDDEDYTDDDGYDYSDEK